VTTVESPTANVVPREQPRSVEAIHIVRPGETLWSIAEQYYGSGQDYPRLVDANLGQSMGNGQVFTRAGVIQPGWSLRVPQASTTIENVEGTYWYTVESGDTLWGISGRVLGDETRWPELFDANRGAQMDDGRALQDPNLIWPSLRLKLPPPIVGVDPDSDASVSDVVAPLAQPTTASTPPATPSAPMPSDYGHATFNAFAVGGGATAALAVAAAAGAALIARRRGRRDLLEMPLSGEPQTDTPIRGGFAEIDPSRDAAQSATLIATLVQRALTGAPRLALLKFGRSRSSAVIQSPREGLPTVRAAATTLATRLGVPIDVRVSRDYDMVLEIATRGGEAPIESAATTLAPVCVLTDRREVWVDPSLGGHVLVASLPGAGADVVLTSLVAALAARRTSSQLRLWTIAAAGQLPVVLDGLPHQVKPRADSHNLMETESALRDVRAELIRRMQRPEAEAPAEEPEIVLVVGELADIEYSPHKTTLDMLGTYGPAHGVRLHAATRDSARLVDDWLAAFGTRLVLRTATPEESQRLLGQTDAADLLGGGQLWARVGARQAIEGYGMRVRPDVLERFVRLQRSRHGLGPVTFAAAEPVVEVAPPHLLDLNLVDAEPGSAIIHMRCFGGFSVHGPGGELVPSVDELTSDAAWDVLARLAASPEGAVATTEVYARLWPEAAAPEDALRGALASLHRMLLRALPSLEGDAVRFADGGATCHLDTRQVISDAHRFLRLCRAAPQMPPDQARLGWQRARGLYTGGLLDGPGARAWPWAGAADAETGALPLRDRYREQAYAATRGLARLALGDGRVEDAVMLYQELLSVEPTLEDVVREVCECYEQLGDFAAIREEEARLNRALQAAYAQASPEDNPLAYEPEPDTLAIFDRARAAAEPRAAAVVAD
jgi:DNA-binding SARP family transcriptional activator/LysM repeat protein